VRRHGISVVGVRVRAGMLLRSRAKVKGSRVVRDKLRRRVCRLSLLVTSSPAESKRMDERIGQWVVQAEVEAFCIREVEGRVREAPGLRRSYSISSVF